MEIEAYLNRIGYAGDRTATVENLRRLLRCHLETVPFENLDFYNNPREISLNPKDLYDKIVTRRRGGVCFELNGLFCSLLEELGYDCYPVSVRVVIPHAPSAISHQGIVVRLEGEKYYCDVGFGGPGPKGLVAMDESGVQSIAGEDFRVEHSGIHCTILSRHADAWVPVLSFVDVASDNADFPILLYYFTANPESHFVRNRVVNLCLPDGSLALTGNRLTIRRGGQTVQQILESEEAVTQTLKKEFGIN